MMKRLTTKFPSGLIAVPQGMMPEALEKLYAYEGTGLDPGNMEHWQEMFKAECDGRLYIAPCDMGDRLYMIVTKRPKINMPEFSFIKVTYLTEHNFFRVLRDFGKTVFLTREEAETALKIEG